MKTLVKELSCLLFPFVLKIKVFESYVHFLISTWQRPERRRRWHDRRLYKYLLSTWMDSVFSREPDPDKREKLKYLAMGGQGGIAWAKEYLNRKVDAAGSKKEFYNSLKEFCKSPEKSVVIQIGASSGRELAYLKSFNQVHLYIGTEIDKQIISYLNNYYCEEGLNFLLCPAHWTGKLLRNYKGYNFIIFSSGTLQYVQPEHLEVFFRQLGDFSNVKLALCEPLDEKFLNSLEAKSVWRGNFSYFHNYKAYAEKVGLRIIKNTFFSESDRSKCGFILCIAETKM
jgi:hypothetical protein